MQDMDNRQVQSCTAHSSAHTLFPNRMHSAVPNVVVDQALTAFGNQLLPGYRSHAPEPPLLASSSFCRVAFHLLFLGAATSGPLYLKFRL